MPPLIGPSITQGAVIASWRGAATLKALATSRTVAPASSRTIARGWMPTQRALVMQAGPRTRLACWFRTYPPRKSPGSTNGHHALSGRRPPLDDKGATRGPASFDESKTDTEVATRRALFGPLPTRGVSGSAAFPVGRLAGNLPARRPNWPRSRHRAGCRSRSHAP